MERFGVSMARLTGVEETKATKKKVEEKVVETDTAASAPAPATANRWAALRGYISATMEQNPAFTDKK